MERIEGLEREHRDLMAGFRTHYAERNPKKLEEEQSRYFAKLYRSEGGRGGSPNPMPLDVMLRFPGFRDYKKPVS